MTEEEVLALGFTHARYVNGEWMGLQRFMFTISLVMGITEYGYRTRFCYSSKFEAAIAFSTWDGSGDPPLNWIKEKKGRVERMNPNYRETP